MSDNRSEYPKMNPEIKALWVEALRSGDYLQGQEALKEQKLGEEEYRHCCLGVLCEVLIAREIMDISVRNLGRTVLFGGTAGYLTKEIRDRTGIATDSHSMLTYLNDIVRLSFSEIADWIEENL